jgi:ATP-dependent DNA helicase RecG
MEIIRDEIGLGRNLYCLPADTGICKDGFQRFDGSVSKLSLPDYSISILHGKMKPADVKRFSDGKLILWSLLVIGGECVPMLP